MNIALSILKLFDITPIIYGVSIPPIDVSAVKTVIAKAEPCNELFDMAYTRGNTGAINSPSKNSDITITNILFVAMSRQIIQTNRMSQKPISFLMILFG